MLAYDLHDAFNISQYFLVPESKHPETLGPNEAITSDVIRIIRMLAAVDLKA